MNRLLATYRPAMRAAILARGRIVRPMATSGLEGGAAGPEHGHGAQVERAGAKRRGAGSALTFLFLWASSILGTTYASHRLTKFLFTPEPTPSSEEEEAYIGALLKARDELAIVRRMRADPAWQETDPYKWLDKLPGPRSRNFTAGALYGMGKYAIRPLLFHDEHNEHAVAIIHIGKGLCGHDGIVHGGLLATICDEMLARVTIPGFESKTGFTANLNINYRKYVPAGEFVIARAERTGLAGRKAYGKAAVTSADESVVHVEATGLFVQPKSKVQGMIDWKYK